MALYWLAQSKAARSADTKQPVQSLHGLSYFSLLQALGLEKSCVSNSFERLTGCFRETGAKRVGGTGGVSIQ